MVGVSFGVRARDQDGGLALLESEEVFHTEQGVSLYVEEDQVGAGSLLVTSRNIVWLCEDPSKDRCFEYRSILMHAVSRDTSSFPHPCLYCHLDEGAEDDSTSELRFVPVESSGLDMMFKAVCDGQALYPEEEQEGEGDFFYNAEEVEAGLAHAENQEEMMERLDRFDQMLNAPSDGQFDDADEDENAS